MSVVITWLSNTCSVPWAVPLPGGMIGPRKMATSGVAIRLRMIHATITMRPWFGSRAVVSAVVGSLAIAYETSRKPSM